MDRFGIKFVQHSHPSLSPCCPSSIFASPSLQPHSILAGPWLHSDPPRPPFHSLYHLPILGLFTSFSASFFSVGGDGGRQEAVEKRRGKVQRKRGKALVDRYQWDTHGTRIGTYRKAMKSRHFNVVIPTRNQHQNPHNWIV